MKQLILLCSYLLLALMSQAQNYSESYTVTALSGLNMRSAPKLQASKLAALPFGSVVQADVSRFGIDNPKKEVEIGGVKGYWMPVTYGSHEGYIFSAYVQAGADVVVRPEGNINKDYRLLREGYYCSFTPINFSPDLHWYALIVNGNKSKLQKVQISIKNRAEFSTEEREEAAPYDIDDIRFKIETDIEERSLLLIGSKHNLAVAAQSNPSFFFHEDEAEGSAPGRFIYPEQRISLRSGKLTSEIGATEQFVPDSSRSDNIRRVYNLHYETFGKNATKTDLSKDLGWLTSARRHAGRSPLLLFEGDINNDGLPDLIFYSDNMSDSCAMVWYHHLFMSDANSATVIRKVAEHVEGSCI